MRSGVAMIEELKLPLIAEYQLTEEDEKRLKEGRRPKEERIPQRWLTILRVIDCWIHRKYPGENSKHPRYAGEAAWREICQHAFNGSIRACILTASGETVEAGRAQFAGLQERYLFQLPSIQTPWTTPTGQPVTQERAPDNRFADKDGWNVRGQLLFHESDLEAALGPAEKAGEIPSLGTPKDLKAMPSKRGKWVLGPVISWLQRFPSRPNITVEELIKKAMKEIKGLRSCSQRSMRTALKKVFGAD
jgi:hypothetical protein